VPPARGDLPFGHELRLFMVWPIWSVLIPFRITFCWSIDDDCAGGFYVRAIDRGPPELRRQLSLIKMN